jgi:hypothetical protein
MQRGSSPSHSVHLAALMANVSPFMAMAALGHSNSQAPHAEHWDATILKAIFLSFGFKGQASPGASALRLA